MITYRCCCGITFVAEAHLQAHSTKCWMVEEERKAAKKRAEAAALAEERAPAATEPTWTPDDDDVATMAALAGDKVEAKAVAPRKKAVSA